MKPKPREAPIPKKPKFKDRKRLFLVVEVVSANLDAPNERSLNDMFDGPLRYVLHGEHWLTRDEEIMYGLKGWSLELLSDVAR